MVDTTINLILVVLLCSQYWYYSAEAQSAAVQTGTPFAVASATPIVWDLSTLSMIIGALIVTLLLVFLFVMFLRRFTLPHTPVPVPVPVPVPQQSSKGIHPQLLQTFPILTYITKESSPPPQCTVCLADFNDGDTLRLLQQCNHVFHAPCIDLWLSSHITCPVCRANLNQPSSSVVLPENKCIFMQP